MDDGYLLPGMIIFAAFILLDAVFYGFASAIQNVNSNNLESEMEEGNIKAGRLLRVINRPGKFINTIQITSNIIGVITGTYVLGRLRPYLERVFAGIEGFPETWRYGISNVLMAIVLMVLLISFGIVIPKRLAVEKPEKWAYSMLPIVSFFMIPVTPITLMVRGLSYAVLRLFGINLFKHDDNVTEEDIMSMVNEGHEQGVLEAREAEMITNIFQLDDKDAGDIMTHRKNIVAIDAETTLYDAVDFILKEGINSRFPVYRKDVDDIIGILHMKDALIYANNGNHQDKPIGEIEGLLREAHFIPETRNIDILFKEMQSKKIHMEIVVDEYGQTSGIVTMEDILEEIVGNILDEYDEDENFITAGEDGTYIMSGMTPLDDVADALDIEFSEEDYDTYDTINGFLISKLDRIPQEGEELKVTYQNYLFDVIRVENKMIHSVKVTPVPKSEISEKTETE